jgi:hypothetical protein
MTDRKWKVSREVAAHLWVMTADKGEEVDTIHRVLNNTYEAGEVDALRRAADLVEDLADPEARAAYTLTMALALKLRVEAEEIEKAPPPEPE